MLFNSYTFLLLFLPAVLGGYFLLGRRHQLAAALFLAVASLFFYGWWNPKYVPMLLISVIVNYSAGISAARALARGSRGTAKFAVVAGIAFDLLLLGYYKYANFFVNNLDVLTGTHWMIGNIILPLGISFFTFTQIAFLADTYKGLAREYNFVYYTLFVTYFPHLIAGPILHHKEMMPQFAVAANYRPHATHFAVGFTIFFIGLFKKVCIADNIAIYVAPVFDAVARGEGVTFFDAWGGALSYTLQLYFDFSGYSDMAIGLSRLFGVTLPVNFNSPYKATNITEFWRRWHMTLSRFLRDYLYIPLGGNRHGSLRRYGNLLITMLLGGLWHGAGWTFVVWGGLHGAYLVVNHAWQALADRWRHDRPRPSRAAETLSLIVTFAGVVVGWVFFRAKSLDGAVLQLHAMAGLGGIVLPHGLAKMLPVHLIATMNAMGLRFGSIGQYFQWPSQAFWIAAPLAGCWLLPNTQQILAAYRPVLEAVQAFPGRISVKWAPTLRWAVVVAMMAIASLLSMNRVSEFLYFQF